MNSSDDDDALPGWMADYTSPDAKTGRLPVIGLSSSDDDDNDSPERQVSPTQEDGTQTKSSPAEEPHPEDVEGEPTAAPSEAPTATRPASTSKKRPPKPTGRAKAAAGAKAGPSSAAQPAGTAAAAVGDDVAAKAIPKPITAAMAGELPIMIPEKLVQNRMIAELESLEGGATDLTGDSGAVGRILVREVGDSKHMQLDLKGIVYNAVHAPMASTLCVVNIGQTEAKVESVLHSFLQLQRANPDESDEEDHKIFMDEDDDNFQFTPAYARDAAEGDGKPAKPAKKKAGTSRKAAPKRPAGVKKKKPAKPKKRK